VCFIIDLITVSKTRFNCSKLTSAQSQVVADDDATNSTPHHTTAHQKAKRQAKSEPGQKAAPCQYGLISVNEMGMCI